MARSKWPEVQKRLHEIEQWLKQGLAEYQIVKNLGVSKTTWEKYKKQQPELFELLKKGREGQVSEVENALFKNATGYYYTEDVAIKVKTKDGEKVETVRLRKYKAAETGAIAFFLKNRNRKEWTDNPQMLELKREEIEIRRKESEAKAW